MLRRNRRGASFEPSGAEPVADAVHRGDVTRMRRVLLDLLAQARDVLVQGPCCSLVLHSPHLVQDGEAIQRLSLAGGEQAKQADFPLADVELPLSRCVPSWSEDPRGPWRTR